MASTQAAAAPPQLQPVADSKDFSFPAEERRILALWDELDAFHEQMRRTEGKPEYVFFDGPPFATGLPHYGHILAGTLKVRTLVAGCARAVCACVCACVHIQTRLSAARAHNHHHQTNPPPKKQTNKN